MATTFHGHTPGITSLCMLCLGENLTKNTTWHYSLVSASIAFISLNATYYYLSASREVKINMSTRAQTLAPSCHHDNIFLLEFNILLALSLSFVAPCGKTCIISGNFSLECDKISKDALNWGCKDYTHFLLAHFLNSLHALTSRGVPRFPVYSLIGSFPFSIVINDCKNVSYPIILHLSN